MGRSIAISYPGGLFGPVGAGGLAGNFVGSPFVFGGLTSPQWAGAGPSVYAGPTQRPTGPASIGVFGGPQRRGNNSADQCFYCGQFGHTQAFCRQLSAAPPRVAVPQAASLSSIVKPDVSF